VKATLTSTSGLANQARELGEIMDSMVSGNFAANGNQTGTTKRRRTKKPAADERG
jgi:hypothetical protein